MRTLVLISTAVALALCGGVAQARPRDHTPPTITITSPKAATYQQGQTVIATYSCSDPSGVRSCANPVPSGQAIDTRTAGSFGFTVRASDALGNSTSKSVVYKVQATPQSWDCSNGYVALTFDDGPTGLTQQYLDTLKSGAAHATFFDIGSNMTTKSGQPLVRATVAYGNALGDHTMTHPDLTTLTDSQV